MLRLRFRERIKPLWLMAGDSLRLTIRDTNGSEPYTHVEDIGRSMKVDQVLVYDVVNQFGLKDGIAVIVGEVQQ